MIVFDDMTADILNNKNLNPIETELFMRGKKFNTLFSYENSKRKRTSINFI